MSGSVALRRSSRAALFTSSALRGVIVITAAALPAVAFAQSVNRTETGNITETRDSISGGPTVVNLTSQGGNVLVDIGTIAVQNDTNTRGFGVVANTSGAGTLDLTLDQIVGSGTGNVSGIVGQTAAGAIRIDSGEIRARGDGGFGIGARTTAGNISITSDSIVTSGVNLLNTNDPATGQATAIGASGISAITTSGNVVIESGSITTTGAGGIGIGVQLGAQAMPGTIVSIRSGNITASADAISLQVRGMRTNNSAIIVDGAVASAANGIALDNLAPQPFNASVTIEAGGSLRGLTGIATNRTVAGAANRPVGTLLIVNNGAITGTGGVAIEASRASPTNISNLGTINGSVRIAGGTMVNRGTINGNVENLSGAGAFLYEGATNGLTGTVTGGSGLDSYGRFFAQDGRFELARVLPTGFERNGVRVEQGATVTLATAAGDASPIRGVVSYGDRGALINTAGAAQGSIVNEANLTGDATASAPAFLTTDFSAAFGPDNVNRTYNGAGRGLASFLNRATISGGAVITTADLRNEGTIERSSTGSLTVITANRDQSFNFANSGTIRLIDAGRTTAQFGSAEASAYGLPEPAIWLRSPTVQGGVPASVPVALLNTGTIDGGLLSTVTATTLSFENRGTISGLIGQGTETNGAPRIYSAVKILTDANYLSGPQLTRVVAGDSAQLVNSGTITGGIDALLNIRAVSFTNSGTIDGYRAQEVSAVDIVQELNSGADAATMAFANSGTINGRAEIESTATSFIGTNSGRIIALGEDNNALGIDNETDADQSFAFTNIATGEIRTDSVGGTALELSAGAGIEPGEDPNPEEVAAAVTMTVVNAGKIISSAGGSVEQIGDGAEVDLAFALELGFDPSVLPSSVTLTNEAGGLISAAGERSAALITNADRFTLVNRGTISAGAGTRLGAGQSFSDEFENDDDGAQATFIAGAIQTLTSIDDITNSGTITGSVDLGTGNDRFENGGTLDGAMTMGEGDDELVLTTGSIITTAADGGAGTDSVRLRGTGTTSAANQSLAATTGFELLDVAQGYWTTGASQSRYEAVRIGANATLELREFTADTVAQSPIATGSVVNDGTLVLNFAGTRSVSSLGNLAVSGTGGVTLTGAGRIVADTATLTYTGPTCVQNGTLAVTGTLASNVETSGAGTFVLGTGGTFTGNLTNNGSFIFDRTDDYSFLGAFTGTGSLIKNGAGTLAFDGFYGFEGTTTINGGVVRIAGAVDPETEVEVNQGTFDIGGREQEVAELSGGSGGTVNVQGGELTVNQDSNSEFAGTITGAGELVKSGSGRLNLTGTNTYSGPTTVDEGTLAVNGSVVSPVTVNQGGRLGGTGSLRNVTIASGGTFAPGNSIGTTNVVNAAFLAGSIYEVEVDPVGASDLVAASGTATIASTATVQVLAGAGTYQPQTSYTIVTAAGGVTGTFGGVTSNLAFLTPALSYPGNAVRLTLTRNDIDFSAVGQTPNQVVVANAVEGLPFTSPIFTAVLNQNAAGARTAFDALSGEIHASLPTLLQNDARLVRNLLLANGRAGAEGFGIWGSLIGNWGEVGARGGVARVDSDSKGVLAGIDFGQGGFRAGLGFGLSNADYRSGARASRADVDSKYVGAHAGYSAGPFAAQIAASYAWHDVDTSRSAAFTGFTGSAAGSYGANTTQIVAEIIYDLLDGPVHVAPIASVGHIRTSRDAFTETGTIAALGVAKRVMRSEFVTAGLLINGVVAVSGGEIVPQLKASYRRNFGDRTGITRSTFGGGTPFTVQGARLANEAIDIDAGVEVRFGSIRIGASYVGALAGRWDDHGGKLTFGFSF